MSYSKMSLDNFRENLLTHFDRFRHVLVTETGDWVVKGFIDVYKKSIQYQ